MVARSNNAVSIPIARVAALRSIGEVITRLIAASTISRGIQDDAASICRITLLRSRWAAVLTRIARSVSGVDNTLTSVGVGIGATIAIIAATTAVRNVINGSSTVAAAKQMSRIAISSSKLASAGNASNVGSGAHASKIVARRGGKRCAASTAVCRVIVSVGLATIGKVIIAIAPSRGTATSESALTSSVASNTGGIDSNRGAVNTAAASGKSVCSASSGASASESANWIRASYAARVARASGIRNACAHSASVKASTGGVSPGVDAKCGLLSNSNSTIISGDLDRTTCDSRAAG